VLVPLPAEECRPMQGRLVPLVPLQSTEEVLSDKKIQAAYVQATCSLLKWEICKLQSLPKIGVILPFLKSFAGAKERSHGESGVCKFQCLLNSTLLCYC